MKILNIDIEETLEQIFQDDETAEQIIYLIKTLEQGGNNDSKMAKNAA